MEVGKITAGLYLDQSEFDKGLSQAEGKAGHSGSAIGTALKTGVVAGVAAATTAVVGGTKAFADYEMGLASVSKTTGLAGSELKALGDDLRDMSTQGPVTVSALEDIAAAAGSLGIGAAKMASGDLAGARQEILSFTDTMSDMAIAFEMDAGLVATSMADIGNVFKIQTEDLDILGSQINALENTMSATAPGIIDFVNAFGGTATMWGETAADTAAFGATLSSLGVKGPEAATAIRSGLAMITSDGDKMAAMADIMGISVEDLSRKMGDDLYGTLIEMGGAINTIEGDTKKAAAATEIFGNYGYQALAKLGGGADVYAQALKNVVVTGDELAAEAGVMADTLAGQWQRLKNSINDVGISIGEITEGPVKSLLNFLNTQAIPAVKRFITDLAGGDVDWQGMFSKLPDIVKEAFKKAVSVAQSIWGGLRGIANDVASWLRDVDWRAVWDTVILGAHSAFGALRDIGDYIVDSLRDIDWGSIWSDLKGIADFIVGEIRDIDWGSVGQTIRSSLSGIWEGITDLGGQVRDKFLEVDWGSVGRTVAGLIGAGFAALMNVGGQVKSALEAVDWSDVGDRIISGIQGAISAASTLASALSAKFTEWGGWSAVGETIISAVKTTINAASDLGQYLSQKIESYGGWDAIGQKIVSSIKSIFGNAIDLATTLGDKIKSWTGWAGVGDTARDKITGAWAAYMGWADAIQSRMGEWAAGAGPHDVGEKIGVAIADALRGIAAFGQRIGEAISNFFLGGDGASVVERVAGAISNLLTNLKEWGSIGLNIISGVFSGIMDGLAPLGAQLKAGMIDIFLDVMESLPYSDRFFGDWIEAQRTANEARWAEANAAVAAQDIVRETSWTSAIGGGVTAARDTASKLGISISEVERKPGIGGAYYQTVEAGGKTAEIPYGAILSKQDIAERVDALLAAGFDQAEVEATISKLVTGNERASSIAAGFFKSPEYAAQLESSGLSAADALEDVTRDLEDVADTALPTLISELGKGSSALRYSVQDAGQGWLADTQYAGTYLVGSLGKSASSFSTSVYGSGSQFLADTTYAGTYLINSGTQSGMTLIQSSQSAGSISLSSAEASGSRLVSGAEFAGQYTIGSAQGAGQIQIRDAGIVGSSWISSGAESGAGMVSGGIEAGSQVIVASTEAGASFISDAQKAGQAFIGAISGGGGSGTCSTCGGGSGVLSVAGFANAVIYAISPETGKLTAYIGSAGKQFEQSVGAGAAQIPAASQSFVRSVDKSVSSIYSGSKKSSAELIYGSSEAARQAIAAGAAANVSLRDGGHAALGSLVAGGQSVSSALTTSSQSAATSIISSAQTSGSILSNYSSISAGKILTSGESLGMIVSNSGYSWGNAVSSAAEVQKSATSESGATWKTAVDESGSTIRGAADSIGNAAGVVIGSLGSVLGGVANLVGGGYMSGGGSVSGTGYSAGGEDFGCEICTPMHGYNALIYTAPNGTTYAINPMTLQAQGGISGSIASGSAKVIGGYSSSKGSSSSKIISSSSSYKPILSHYSGFAEGGVVEGPQLALVGDNPSGREAIIPEEVWGDKGGNGGGSQTIIIQLDGKTIGRAVAPRMAQEIRVRTGSRVN